MFSAVPQHALITLTTHTNQEKKSETVDEEPIKRETPEPVSVKEEADETASAAGNAQTQTTEKKYYFA